MEDIVEKVGLLGLAYSCGVNALQGVFVVVEEVLAEDNDEIIEEALARLTLHEELRVIDKSLELIVNRFKNLVFMLHVILKQPIDALEQKYDGL